MDWRTELTAKQRKNERDDCIENHRMKHCFAPFAHEVRIGGVHAIRKKRAK
jgi:hypothetical protein